MTFEEFLEEWRGDIPYITAHTSGSTGRPKEIRLDKEFVRESASRTNSFFAVGPGSRLHSCVAADYIGGKMMAVRSELAGCRFTWEPPSNRPLCGMKGETIDLLAVVPSQMVHILDHPEDMPRLNGIIIGGSPLPEHLRRRIALSGLPAFESYGMTETASHIALRRVEATAGWFRALPGIVVTADPRGCLAISFGEGREVVTTNDMAEVRGDEFRITGRYDHMIITGGKKVNPVDVEGRISHLFRKGIMLTSEPDEKWGERVVLLAEDAPDADERAKTEVRMRELLANYEMPKQIHWGSRLAYTPNGKLMRRKKVDSSLPGRRNGA